MSNLSPAQDNPLIGIWKLVSAIAIHPDGIQETNIYGANPNGYITYTATGHMMVMFARGDRPPFSQTVQSPLSNEMSTLPVEELAQALITFNAYAGTYRVEGNSVTHHLEIASIPNRVSTALVRTFTVRGDHLTLITPPTWSNGMLQVFELVWKRVDP
jgi:Lipocalin-like domain